MSTIKCEGIRFRDDVILPDKRTAAGLLESKGYDVKLDPVLRMVRVKAGDAKPRFYTFEQIGHVDSDQLDEVFGRWRPNPTPEGGTTPAKK